MESTIILQIPYVFFGRKEVMDPDNWSAEERQTQPAQDIHAALRKACTNVDVRLATDSQAPQEALWTLRQDSTSSRLTMDERAKLPPNIWSVLIVLQRVGIPLHTDLTAWHVFASEATSLLAILDRWNTETAPIPPDMESEHRCWAILPTSQCNLHISLVPDGNATLPLDLVKRVLITFAALERELTLLSTPSALMEYWPLSRFLEWRAIRQLGDEKARLWKRLGEREGSSKRKAEVYRREKMKWMAGFGDEEMGFERVEGRRREWCDVLDGIEIGELVGDMSGFRRQGLRMSVEIEGEGMNGAKSDDIEEPTASNNRIPTKSSTSTTPAPSVTAISIPSYPSTTSTPHLLAYTSLIASLLALSVSHTHTNLLTFLAAHRSTSPTEPLPAFAHLLTALHVSKSARQFWTQYLHPLFSETPQTHNPLTSSSLLPSPFTSLENHLAHTHAAQRAYIPTFIARYMQAGGFAPTPGKKAYALLLADEHARRNKTSRKVRGNEEWLEGVREAVKVGDAWEGDDGLDERGRKTPEVKGEERRERDEWVLEGLMR